MQIFIYKIIDNILIIEKKIVFILDSKRSGLKIM